MNPHMVLLRYPGETLPWLRRRLGLSRRAFATWLGVTDVAVARWERRATRIPLAFHGRLVPILERYLTTPEGSAFVRSLGRGEDR